MPKKITLLEAKDKFLNQGREDIVLCDESYISWTKKARFYDLTEEDFFWAKVYRVFDKQYVHPNRRKEKTKETNLKNTV